MDIESDTDNETTRVLDELLLENAGNTNKAQQRLKELESQRTDIQFQIADLSQERRGLELARGRFPGGDHPKSPPSPDRTPTPSNREWAALPRTDAVARVLQEAGTAMSVSQILNALTEHGRSDRRDVVSASLSHLKRKGRTHTVSRGEWKAGADPWQVDGGPLDAATEQAQFSETP